MPDQVFPIVSPADISAEWITQVLRHRGIDADVASFTTETVGTGQLGETRRFALTYRGSVGENAPRSVVGKFTSDNPVSAETGHSLGIYRSEVMFYRTLADKAGLRTPDVYAAEIDEHGRFVLLLEDLAPARPGNQLSRCTVEDVRTAITEAALLHASFWDDRSIVEHDWLAVPEGAQGFYTTELIEQSWAHVQQSYDGQLPFEVMQVCDTYVRHHAEWNKPRPGPRCLSHNDFRPDNMMFGGLDGRIALVDWQTVSFLSVGMDVPYLLSGALDREVRADVETSLLRGYHEQLEANGVTGYTFERLAADYRHYTFAALAVAIAATLLVKRTERGDRMLMQMITDAAYHVLDTGSLDVLGA